jgi:hypothetical protein
MMNERLDKEHEEMILDIVLRNFTFLDVAIPESEKYSKANLTMNVLFGCICLLAEQISEENHEEFIQMACHNLRENFKLKNKMKRFQQRVAQKYE